MHTYKLFSCHPMQLPSNNRWTMKLLQHLKLATRETLGNPSLNSRQKRKTMFEHTEKRLTFTLADNIIGNELAGISKNNYEKISPEFVKSDEDVFDRHFYRHK